MFTQNWFNISGRKNFEKYLIPLFKDKLNLRFLEIGCFEGMATLWLLKNILTHSTSRIVCIDTFKGSEEHKKLTSTINNLYTNFYINTKEYKHKIDIYIGTSETQLRRLDGNFDFIYIDGSHFAPDVLSDAVLSFPLLKKGGIMIFDDAEWNNRSKAEECPKLGVDSFLNTFVGKYEILLKDYQIVIKKL